MAEPSDPPRRRRGARPAMTNGSDDWPLWLKPSELMRYINCSRGTLDIVMGIPDFPPLVSITGDGRNLRCFRPKVDAWMERHGQAPGIAGRRQSAGRSAEEAVKEGLEDLRRDRGKATRRFT